MLALVIPLIAVGARRFNDTNKSSWWQQFALIPLAGNLVLAIFFLLPGEPDSNRFGQPEALSRPSPGRWPALSISPGGLIECFFNTAFAAGCRADMR